MYTVSQKTLHHFIFAITRALGPDHHGSMAWSMTVSRSVRCCLNL